MMKNEILILFALLLNSKYKKKMIEEKVVFCK